MTMTVSEVLDVMKQEPDRHHQFAYEERGEFVSEYDGREYRAGNPFGLDSKLSDAGMPAPASLYLVEREDVPALEAARDAEAGR